MLTPRSRRLAHVVFEEMVLQPLEGDGLQEPRGDDAIRVDVLAAQRQRPSGDARDSFDGHQRSTFTWGASPRQTPQRRRVC
jgi:hypothetical protein